MRWSVGIEAEGDQVLTREQVFELADAVAASDGIATGIGTSRYGAQLVVEAASQDRAIEAATAEFQRAAAAAGLPRASCWIRRAGSRWKIYVCTYEVPGGTSSHREQIARELIAIYQPGCNEQRYDRAWKAEWIGKSGS